jgi:hypothetical protein
MYASLISLMHSTCPVYQYGSFVTMALRVTVRLQMEENVT